MFDKAIIDTDRFMDLGMTSKGLYFLLGMEADDEGFVSYKKVMRVHGGNEDDMKVLVAKGFVLSFPSGVVVITDWNKNNYLDKHRITPTEYQKERKLLVLTEDKNYEFNVCSTSIEENSIVEKRIEENNTAEKVAKAPDEVALVIKAFEEIDPKNKTYYGHTGQRSACKFLLKEYGLEEILEAVEALKGVYAQENLPAYFPSITSPYDLKEKWLKVTQYVSREKSKTLKETNEMKW